MTRRPMLLTLSAVIAFAGCAASAQSPAQSPAPAPAPIPGAGEQPFLNHKVVRVMIKDEADLATMEGIAGDMLSCIERVGGPVDYRVEPDRVKDLEASGLRYVVLNENLQASIDAERASLAERGTGWFSNYKQYSEIDAYLTQLVGENPAIASRFILGTNSIEGRQIYGIRISGPGAGPKPAFVVEGTQHAREWVAAMVPMYLADQLVQLYTSDASIRDIVDRSEIYIIPVANPDGYVYSWASPSNRLWRKNRRPNAGGSFGVDNNRNWGFQWGGSGASTTPSNDTYRGTGPFSEPETQALRDFIISKPNTRAHLDWHSYSQLVMWPWGYTTALAPDNTQMNRFGQGMRSAILAATNVPYTAGPTGPTLYLAAGNANDWVYGAQNVFSYVIELRDTGATGFQLPAAQILPTAQENFAAWKTLATQVVNPIDFTPAATPSTTPRLTPVNLSVTLAATLKTTLNASSPRVFYRIGNAGPYTGVAMTAGGGGVYTAQLPGAFCGAVIQYYYEAATTFGDTQDFPNLALGAPLAVAVSNPPSCVGVPGDVNQDGQVNFNDLNVVLSGFGTTYSFADLNQVLSNFGTTG